MKIYVLGTALLTYLYFGLDIKIHIHSLWKYCFLMAEIN